MTDIVERLRNPSGDIFPMCREAADVIERLRSIIRKQMEPTEISRRLAECNELSDAYAEQCVEIKQMRAELEQMREEWNELVQVAREARRALEPKQ